MENLSAFYKNLLFCFYVNLGEMAIAGLKQKRVHKSWFYVFYHWMFATKHFIILTRIIKQTLDTQYTWFRDVMDTVTLINRNVDMEENTKK